MKLGVQTHFDASHSDRVGGKDYSLHGHTYALEVVLEKNTAFIMDFNKLHELVREIVSPWNERHLNDFFDNPTCETLAQHIAKEVKKKAKGCTVHVKLEQGKNQWVEVTA